MTLIVGDAGKKGARWRGWGALGTTCGIEVGRFGCGFLPPLLVALIQKLCSVYQGRAGVLSWQPLSHCHAIDVTQ